MQSTRSVYRQKPLSHELRSEWVSQRANEWAQRSARAKRAVRRKRMSERCRRTSKWRSEWPRTLRVNFISFVPTVQGARTTVFTAITICSPSLMVHVIVIYDLFAIYTMKSFHLFLHRSIAIFHHFFDHKIAANHLKTLIVSTWRRKRSHQEYCIPSLRCSHCFELRLSFKDLLSFPN